MRFEDYARGASRALSASGQDVDVPQVAEMLARRRREGLILGSTAIVVLVAGVVATVAALGSLTGGGEEVSVPAATVPVEGGGVLFDPPRIEGADTVEFPITLLDGTRLTLTLPQSLADEVKGLVPGGAASWELDPCCSRSLEVIYGSIDDLYGERQPDVAYEDADGNPVGFFTEDDDVDNLVFQYGSWVVRAWDGDAAGQRFSDENREMFASLMRGHETADGFLVLDPADPMTIGPTDSPDVTLTNGGGDGLVGVFKSRDCASEGPSGTPDLVTSTGHFVTFAEGSGMTSICFPDSSLYLWVSSLDLTETELEAIDLNYSTDQPTTGDDSSLDVACSSAGGTRFSSSFLNGPALTREEFADTPVGAVVEAFFGGGPGAPEFGQYERAEGFSIVSDSLVLGYDGELPDSFFTIENGQVTAWGSCIPNMVSDDLVAARWEPSGPINVQGRTISLNVDGGACETDDGRDVLTELVEVDVEETESQVTITAWTRDKPFEGFCAGVGVTLNSQVELASPLGERSLLDGGPIPPRVVEFEASDGPPPPTTAPEVDNSSLDRLECSPGIVVEERVPDSGQDPLDVARDAEPTVVEVEPGRPLWWWGLDEGGTVVVGLALGDMDGADYQVWTCDPPLDE